MVDLPAPWVRPDASSSTMKAASRVTASVRHRLGSAPPWQDLVARHCRDTRSVTPHKRLVRVARMPAMGWT